MLRKLVPVMMLAGAAGVASADVLSYSHTIPTSTVPFTDNFTLPKFDPATGTLSGITITTSTSIAVVISIYNYTGAPQTFTNARATVPVTVTAPSGSSTVTGTATVASGSLAPSPPPNEFPRPPVPASAVLTVAAANFGLYTGTGGATASFRANSPGGTYSGTSTVFGVFFGGTSTVGGTVTITYTYTPISPPTQIPEPVSLLLFGTGLAGLGLTRRHSSRLTGLNNPL